MKNKLCPCGSKQSYLECCGLYIESHQRADSAEILMRSRYSAYVVHNVDYLINTYSSSIDTTSFRTEINENFAVVDFIGLQIIHVDQVSSLQSLITFVAYFVEQSKPNEKVHALLEQSTFVQEKGVWFYVDGVKPSQKQACVCGSGKKFKHCCARKITELVRV